MLRAEHQLRLTESKELGLNSSFSVPSSSLHTGQIRTLRGGQSATAAAGGGEGGAAWIQNVIRGKGKATNATGITTPSVSRQNSLFADTLGLRMATSGKAESTPEPAAHIEAPGTPNSTGSATSTARALFSRLMGSQS